MPQRRTSQQWRQFLPYALTLLAAFTLVCFFRYYLRGINDDAMITYRYARNFVEGRGLVYNPGERVLGTTTLLYTFLVAGAMAAGLEPWTFSLAADCLLVTALIALMFRWAWLGGDRWFAWLAAAALLHSPGGLLPNAGMETGLFNLLSYGAIFLAMRGRTRWATAAALGAVLTRPEGILALAVVFFYATVDGSRQKLKPGWWQMPVVSAALLLAVAGILHSYYGQILPQSVVAKHAQVEAGGPWTPFVSQFLHEQMHPFGRFSLLGAMEWIGFGLLVWRQPVFRPLIAWLLLYLAFMFAGKAPFYVWYMSPLYPVRYFAVVYTALSVGRLVAGWMARTGESMEKLPARWQFSAALMGLVLTVALGWFYFWLTYGVFRWAFTNSFPVLYCKKYEEAGAWIASRATRDDEVVSAEIGYIGYLAECRLFDPIGLVSPEAVSQLGKKSAYAWAVERGSRFLVMSWFQQSNFQPIPDSFVEQFHPAGVWRDVVFQTIVFERDRRIQDVLASKAFQDAGILPGLDRAVYAVKGTPGEGDSMVWTVSGTSGTRRIEWSFYPVDATLADVEAESDGETIPVEAGDASGRFVLYLPVAASIDHLTIRLNNARGSDFLLFEDGE